MLICKIKVYIQQFNTTERFYEGAGVIPGNYIEYSKDDPTDDIDMDTTYFNKVAAQAFAEVIR